MDREAAQKRLQELREQICIGDNHPENWHSPEGEHYYYQDADRVWQGFGCWFVIGDEWIWHVENNGRKNDFWGWNNVHTDDEGEGAVGHRVSMDEELRQELLTCFEALGIIGQEEARKRLADIVVRLQDGEPYPVSAWEEDRPGFLHHYEGQKEGDRTDGKWLTWNDDWVIHIEANGVPQVELAWGFGPDQLDLPGGGEAIRAHRIPANEDVRQTLLACLHALQAPRQEYFTATG